MCEDAPCCGCCGGFDNDTGNDVSEFDAEREMDYRDEPEDNMTDVEADADTLASAGYGTDEDYGYFGGNEE